MLSLCSFSFSFVPREGVYALEILKQIRRDKEINNKSLMIQVLNSRGNRFFYFHTPNIPSDTRGISFVELR